MKLATRKYEFQMRGPKGDTHPARAIRIGPLILFGVWFSERKHKRLLSVSGQALLDRLTA